MALRAKLKTPKTKWDWSVKPSQVCSILAMNFVECEASEEDLGPELQAGESQFAGLVPRRDILVAYVLEVGDEVDEFCVLDAFWDQL